MLNILLLLPIIVACNTTQTAEPETLVIDEVSEDSVMESLEKSAGHLDNMIETTEKMSAEMDIMNQNYEQILISVTECKNNNSC